MDIYFNSEKLQKNCNSEKLSVKKWGPEMAKLIQQRLMELRAADCLSDISNLPPPRCHMLDGNRDGCFAVDLKDPFRLVFEPLHNPLPLKDDGGIDRTRVTSILILEVVNYHGKQKRR